MSYTKVMKRKHQTTLLQIFTRPIPGGIRWPDIEAMLVELGAEITERGGSRVCVFLFGEVMVFHRPPPGPERDKGSVASLRKWLKQQGVTP